MILSLLAKMLILAGVTGLGYYLDRAGKISRDGLQALSTLVIHYLLPCLAFSTLVDHFSRDMLSRAGWMPVLGFITFAIGMLVGLATVGLLKMHSPVARRTYVFLAAINNYGYLPLPLVYLLYGEAGAALLFFHNLGCHLFFWTLGIGTLTAGEFNLKAFRNIFNNNLYALAAGFAISVLGWQQYVPDMVMELTRLLGLGAIPLVMVVIGSTMAEIELRKGFPWKPMALISVARLLLAPALFIALLFLFPIPRDYRNICILVALMPCASSAPLFVKEYGGDKAFAAQAVLVTTVVSLLTIPLGMAFFLP